MADTPELHRMKAVAEESNKIGEFLDWLTGVKGIVLAERVAEYTDRCEDQWHCPSGAAFRSEKRRLLEMDACPRCEATDRDERRDVTHTFTEPQLWPARFGGFERLLAEYYSIDLAKVDLERRAILDELTGGRRG